MERELTPAYHPVARVSYRAIVSGAIVFLISLAILLALGSAIGLTAFAGTTADRGIGIGERIWYVFAVCGSAFAGAYVASVVARAVRRRDGVLHGVVAWGLASLFAFGWIAANAAPRALGGSLVGAQPVVSNRQIGHQPLDVQRVRGVTAQPRSESVRLANDQTAAGAAGTLWALFAAHLLGLGLALVGGIAGARSEARYEGLPEEEYWPRHLRFGFKGWHRRREPPIMSPT